MMHILDDQTAINRLDRTGMLKVIDAFPESCVEALKNAEKVDLGNLESRRFSQLVVLGMGGSAVGGILLKDWLQSTCNIPIMVFKEYTIPAFIRGETLIFAVSYSGNTEETLTALEAALRRKSPIVVFTSGGRIAEVAKQAHVPIVILPKGFQPRAAIPYQFFSLAAVANRLNLIGGAWDEVDEALVVLSKVRDELTFTNQHDSNEAKIIASTLKGRLPIIIGSRIHEGVAYRWGTQINENSKSPAFSSSIPEAFHNLIMASEASDDLIGNTCAILIIDPLEKPELKLKTRRFGDLLRSGFGEVIEVNARGKGRLARLLSALLIGDYVSFYLAILYGKDPSSVDSIDALKK